MRRSQCLYVSVLCDGEVKESGTEISSIFSPLSIFNEDRTAQKSRAIERLKAFLRKYGDILNYLTAMIQDEYMPYTHESWKQLCPTADIVYSDDRLLREYQEQLPITLQHIPYDVLKQWICPHNLEFNNICNFSWINYYEVSFELKAMTVSELLSGVVPIDKYKGVLESRLGYDTIEHFHCKQEDIVCWKENGTWRTPPVILNSSSFDCKAIPEGADIKYPFTLIEGHTRFAYLHSISQMVNAYHLLATKHLVYILTK